MPQDVTPYIPQVWADRALLQLRNRALMARLVHRDFEDAVASQGDTVNAHRPMNFVAADVPAGAIVPTDLAPDTVPVVLDKWKHVTFILRDKDATVAMKAALPLDVGEVGVMNAVIAEHIMPAASALAEAVETSLFDLYADIPTFVGTLGTVIDQDDLIDADRALNVQKVPLETRYVIIDPTNKANLLKQPEFTAAQIDPANVDALRTAQLGPHYGFAGIFWSQLVASVAVATPPDHFYNLAFHRDAFALVTRPLETPQAGTIIARAADPESGLSIRLEIGRNMLNKRTEVSLDILYGVKTLDPRLAVVVRG